MLAIDMRNDIGDSLQLAADSRDIWFLINSCLADNLRFAGGIYRFTRFFEATLAAHYSCFVVSLARVYDTSDDAFSITRLFKLVAANPCPEGKPIAEVQAALDAATPVGRRLYTIRSKRIAHRTDKIRRRDFYAEASLSYDVVYSLLRDTQAIFADLSYHLDRTVETFSSRAESEFRALLDAISP